MTPKWKVYFLGYDYVLFVLFIVMILQYLVARLESKFWEAGGELRMSFVILWWLV